MTFRPWMFLRSMWDEAGRDLRSIQSKKKLIGKILLSMIAFILLSGFLALTVILGLGVFYLGSLSACSPSGTFMLNPSDYSYWNRLDVFQINLAFWSLSFSKAKIIDVVWDVVVGRIGQTALAWCSWHVFSLYVTTSMEIAPVTFNSYRAIFMENSPSLSSTVLLLRDFVTRKGLHSKIAMAFMVVAITFTLAFPTLASAMTGYTTTSEAYVPDHQNVNRIRFDQFASLLYIVHDGERIGRTNDFLVLYRQSGEPTFARLNSWRIDPDDDLLRNVTAYAHDYGLHGTTRTNSTFMGITLPAPTLNISAFMIPEEIFFSFARIRNEKDRIWVYSEETYTFDYIIKNGTCQSTVKYQWGFSFVQLFSMNIMLLVWAMGIFVMWFRAKSTMLKRGRESVAGTNKAVIELAAAMLKELDMDDLDSKVLTEKQIQRRIAAAQGGRISYSCSILTEDRLADTSVIEWLQKDRWWIAATVVFVATTSFVWLFGYWLSILIGGPTLGLIVALLIGSTWKSKSLFVLCWTVVGSVAALIVFWKYFAPYYLYYY